MHFTACRRALHHFENDRRGGVATVFGLAVVTLLGAAGTAVDASRAHKGRSALQNAIDAGALAASAAVVKSDDADVPGIGERYAQTNLARNPEMLACDPAVRFWRDGDIVRGEGSCSLQTTLLKVLGIDEMDIAAASAATGASRGIELILVLDVSGSMSGSGKIAAARTAAVGLIDMIYGTAETRPNTYVGLAPFSGRVNIEAYGRSWMSGSAPASAASKLCTALRTTNEETDAPPSAEAFTYFTGNASACPDYEAVGLSAEKTPVRDAVLALQPGHGTSTNKGMVWGWRMISPRWRGLWGSPELPLDYDKSPGKVVVIMTDGQNHPNQSGDPYSTAEADAQLLRECAAMKAEGITIYTIALDMGTTLTSLYQQCATMPDYHKDAEDPAELDEIFNGIGEQVTKGEVRLIH